MLADFNEAKKLTWADDIEFIRKMCALIEQSQIYTDYMSAEEDNYEADREVWRKIYRQMIQDNSDLEALLEEKSLYWNDDKEVVDTFVLKTIKRFDPKNKAKQELLPEYKDAEDKDFAINNPQRRPVPAFHERDQPQLGFLTSGVHGRDNNADCHRRDAYLPQHSRERHHKRVCGACKALQHST